MSAFRNITFKVINRCIFTNQTRFHPRWSHRRPVRVIEPTDSDNGVQSEPIKNVPISIAETEFKEKKIVSRNKIAWKHPTSVSNKQEEQSGNESSVLNYKIKTKIPQSKKTSETTDLLLTVLDKDGNFVYTKMKDRDVRISKIMTKVKNGKDKELILLEGKRLIKDALQSECNLQYLLFSRKDEVEFLKPYLPNTGAHLYKMPYTEIQMWSDLSTCPGIMGVFKTPNLENVQPKKNCLPVTVICDNVREPGNLGAIIRTCAAVGCRKIILTKGCVDLWSSKVTRSASGSHFKIQISSKVNWEKINEMFPEKTDVFVADNNIAGNKRESNLLEVSPYCDVCFKNSDNLALIVGGETEGIGEDAMIFASKYNGQRINIPLENDVDSLNTGTALGIILYEVKRQFSIK